MKYRTFFAVFVVCVIGIDAQAQREYKTPEVAEFDRKMFEEKVERRKDELWRASDDEIKDYLDPVQSNVRTRFGVVPMRKTPERLMNEHPRVPGAMVFGRNNRFLGINPDDPSLRIKPLPTGERSLPSDNFSGQTLVVTEAASPANRPIQGDAPSTGPIQRPIGFFERPGIMEPPPLVSEESLIRTPSEQRWFRDLGRRSDQPGLGGLADRDLPLPPHAQAVAVGGEEMLQRETSETSGASVSTIRQPTATDQAAQRRRFEQKLEGMLLSNPGVHFLSPVQVSFQNGIVTVRGVVPNQQHKVAAGNVLLSDPAIRQVNNLISIVPLDPSQNPAPIEPKP